jgi:hypothetical protein
MRAIFGLTLRWRVLAAILLASGLILSTPAYADDSDSGAPRLNDLHEFSWLTISGAQRTRYESLSGQFRAGGSGGDQLLSLRTSVKAEARLGDIRFVGELSDARTYLGDSGTPLGPNTTNAMEPIQLFAETSLATHNVRDFAKGAARFGLRVLRPGDVLKELRSSARHPIPSNCLLR